MLKDEVLEGVDGMEMEMEQKGERDRRKDAGRSLGICREVSRHSGSDRVREVATETKMIGGRDRFLAGPRI